MSPNNTPVYIEDIMSFTEQVSKNHQHTQYMGNFTEKPTDYQRKFSKPKSVLEYLNAN